ncbi:hypothetical protein [Streptomyces sp. TP-A0356]|uniref:hypothetical protein n=1 Tax=Streptomyces sp. TP-A0356 TaxID=1359208 RepID=UPI00131C4C14|nr:hypothetical protein [Streptomyces sp. TP-A0356]
MKASRTTGALAITAALLALAGCGSGDASGSKDTASSSPTAQADPYHDAPWRMQVVNLLDALRTPQDGRYRNWMPDSADNSLDFAYTPRTAGDPGWADRNNKGYAVVYPGQLGKPQKTAFFKAITRDDTVVASSLTVTRADSVPREGNADYKFAFKVKTTDGKWLTGQAIGNGTDASRGRIIRLVYDTSAS